MALKITGLDALARKLKEAESAAAALDGELANVTFDPDDPASIEQAIQDFYRAVDERTAKYLGNDLVAEMAERLKEEGRTAILERAAIARLDDGDDDE